MQALVQTYIASAGTAGAFQRASQISRTRMAHQGTVAALFALQQNAHKHHRDQLVTYVMNTRSLTTGASRI